MVIGIMPKVGHPVIYVTILNDNGSSLFTRQEPFFFVRVDDVYLFDRMVSGRMFRGSVCFCISLWLWALQRSSWLCCVLCFSFGTSEDC